MYIKKPDQKCLDCSTIFKNRNGRKFRCDICQKIYSIKHRSEYAKKHPKDPLKQKNYSELWRERHPDRAKEVWRNYRLRNLELCRERTRINQVILNDKKRFGGFRKQALERDNFKCQRCGKDVSGKRMAAIHHINHNKMDNRLENFQTLCHRCHASHHDVFRIKNERMQYT